MVTVSEAGAEPVGKGPRTVRLGELLREVLAEELERIDDPRLELVSITNVEVDAELNRAIVSFDSLAGRGRRRGDPRGLRRPPRPAPGGGRPADPRAEDARCSSSGPTR